MPAPRTSPRPEPRPDRNREPDNKGFNGIDQRNRGDGNELRKRTQVIQSSGGGNPNPNGRQASPRNRTIYNTKMGVATEGVERSGQTKNRTDFSNSARLGEDPNKNDPRYK